VKDIDYDQEFQRIRLVKSIEDEADWLVKNQPGAKLSVAKFKALQYTFAGSYLDWCLTATPEEITKMRDEMYQLAEQCREIGGYGLGPEAG
jgi:hypothetical protein